MRGWIEFHRFCAVSGLRDASLLHFSPFWHSTRSIRIIPNIGDHHLCGGYLTYPSVISPSSRPSVVMVQTTKNGDSDNRLIGLCCSVAISFRRNRNTVNTLMGTRAVEVVDVFAD